jgi:para-nitrobenzyl esterase
MTSDMTVMTSGGLVRGVGREGSAAFYGIPYAAPPVGCRAFEAPAAPAPWTGVRDATRPGATAQHRGFDGGTIPEPSVAGEDILTVNVFTPRGAPSAGGLPVMVFIHGGAYIAGSPTSPWYDGCSFNRDGVVVVTVGYRLGVLGFGVLPDAEQNRAVLDWLAALCWVRENVAAFGGDPARVTIAGQSAGGGAVLALLGVRGIEGLAHRAIAASPVLSQVTLEQGRDVMGEAAALLGAEPTAAGLGAVSRELVDDVPWRTRNAFGKAASRATGETDPVETVRAVLGSIEFAPALDGELLVSTIAEGVRGSRIPLLLGAAAHEMTGEIPPNGASLDAAALERLGLGAQEARRYLEGCEEDAERWGQLLTDAMFRAAVPLLAEGREGTWAYDFRHRAGGEVDPGHAFHCTDLPFAWDRLGAEGVGRALGDPPQELAEQMHGAWVSFIVDGSPGWESYDAGGAVRRFMQPGSETVRGGYRHEGHLVPLVQPRRRPGGGSR